MSTKNLKIERPSKLQNADDLAIVGRFLYGTKGWQTPMAKYLGVDGSTIRRWTSGAVPITNPAKAALLCACNLICAPKERTSLTKTSKK